VRNSSASPTGRAGGGRRCSRHPAAPGAPAAPGETILEQAVSLQPVEEPALEQVYPEGPQPMKNPRWRKGKA